MEEEMTTSNHRILELRLYDNAIDFINKSMESYQRAVSGKEIIEFKYAILLLANGCELIFKSILEDKHPLFVKRNIDNADEKTVAAENLISRVNKVYFDEKKMVKSKDTEIFESIRNIRNSIIHKEVIFDQKNDPSLVYAKTLYSLDRVVKQFKGKSLSNVVNNWNEVVNIPHIKEAYFQDVKGIELKEIKVPCALCSIEKIVNENDKVKCINCGHIYENLIDAIQSLDDENLRYDLTNNFIEIKLNEGLELFDCPNCYMNLAWYDEEKAKINCFKCISVNGDICYKCGENTVIREFVDVDKGLIGVTDYCLNCMSLAGDYCYGCGKDEFMLEKVEFDVRRQEKFIYEFPSLQKDNDGAFWEAKICPECISRLYDLEDKGVVDLANIKQYTIRS
jgi:hypothetical protein